MTAVRSAAVTDTRGAHVWNALRVAMAVLIVAAVQLSVKRQLTKV